MMIPPKHVWKIVEKEEEFFDGKIHIVELICEKCGIRNSAVLQLDGTMDAPHDLNVNCDERIIKSVMNT